ncbi:adenosylcobinamide amidohydrolase [Shinella daejeonensis]|uniref:adenosylcobinamide amidohydrolase n=1 Tax=Shinella daejeonensis TaxID=659017 RepID=UPI0020C832A0|nr:adenosylcobinamide amidohydrolase [Shinella daejeonensis]MCP8895139.1 adenosylcobinamide amidohydrolase [Shinella daejeonensis]
MTAFSVHCRRPFLVAAFAAPQTMLSWSLTRPGFTRSKAVAWLEVRDADLPLGVDPLDLLETRMAAAGHGEAVHLMTSRDVTRFETARSAAGGVEASCLATVGLSNAGRIGEPFTRGGRTGTINLLAHVDRPLCEAAMIEALSIATEARTAAVMELGLLRNGLPVTGTGTDCVVVAAPEGAGQERFAGLHTDIGLALGRSVYDAVRAGGLAWIAEHGRPAAGEMTGFSTVRADSSRRGEPPRSTDLPSAE